MPTQPKLGRRDCIYEYMETVGPLSRQALDELERDGWEPLGPPPPFGAPQERTYRRPVKRRAAPAPARTDT